MHSTLSNCNTNAIILHPLGNSVRPVRCSKSLIDRGFHADKLILILSATSEYKDIDISGDGMLVEYMRGMTRGNEIGI